MTLGESNPSSNCHTVSTTVSHTEKRPGLSAVSGDGFTATELGGVES